MLEYWLWYAQRELTGGQKRILLEHFRDPEELYRAGERRLRQIEGMSEQILETLLDRDLTKAQLLQRQCARAHIQVLTFTDERYPERLRTLHDAPVVLYYQGVLPDWNRMPVIGIVGTRQSTGYGNQLAADMSAQIAACGGMVISGGAKGIDTVALESALAAGGVTVAVLAGGLDKYYPASNTPLFRRMCNTGCLITEYPPGTPSQSWNFPVRNRIISGMSNGLLVVEAPAKSGALISARYAMEQGRDVFAVPGSVNMPSCEGTNALLREGARTVLSGWDVMKEYESLYPDCVRLQNVPPRKPNTVPQVAQPVIYPEAADKKSVDNTEKDAYSVVRTAKFTLTEQEQALVACVGREGGLMDEIIAASGLQAAEANKLMTRLALKKVLVLHPGGRVTLN